MSEAATVHAVSAAAPKEPGDRTHKLRRLLANEIAAVQQSIGRLTAKARETQDALALERAKLPALLQCVEALDGKRMPSPITSAPSASIFQTTARREMPAVVEEPEPGDDGAILASYGTVLKFAMTRGMKFECWDDLPGINRKREDLNMPTFKRDMTAKSGGRG